MEFEVWVTLGDRLSLSRGTIRGTDPAGFGVDILSIHHVDAEGRLVFAGIYHLEDLDGALRDLFARWRADG